MRELDEMSESASMVTEMSKKHPIVYFGINKRLYVWDYRRAQQMSRNLTNTAN